MSKKNILQKIVHSSISTSSYIKKESSSGTPFKNLKYLDVIINYICETTGFEEAAVLSAIELHYNNMVNENIPKASDLVKDILKEESKMR